MDQVIHLFNEVMTVLNWLARNVPWDAVAASGVLSGLLIGPQKIVKKWFEHNEPIIIAVIGLVGPLVVASWTYLLHHYGTDPRIVVLQGLAVSFMTQPFYFVVWKPFVLNRLAPQVRNWFASKVAAQFAAAREINEVRATAVPAPVSATVRTKTPVPIQDFKP
jgi:hypothetical protein